jgi:hypothetical protein
MRVSHASAGPDDPALTVVRTKLANSAPFTAQELHNVIIGRSTDGPVFSREALRRPDHTIVELLSYGRLTELVIAQGD